MGPVRRSIVVQSAAALIAVPFVPALYAQQAPPASEAEAPEQVVVTAEKRASLLQDVPFSVAAPNETQIRNSGADSIVDLARNVAGLSIADLGPGQSQVAIRGISSGQVIRDQPGLKEQVGIYLDESPISVALFTPDLVLYDIDRFEVLRGPQGTLFGAGSEAGTLRYITKQPRLGVSESNVEATGEWAASNDVGGSVRAMTNVPLGDTAALRAVLYTDHQPGFIDAVRPFTGQINENVNSANRDGSRVAVLWKATENLTVEPRLVWQILDSGGFPREDVYNILANPYTTTIPALTIGPRQQVTQQPEGLTDQFELTDLKLDYDLGPAALTSVTSYTHRKITVRRDATQLSGSVTYDLGTPGGTGLTATPAEVDLNSPLYDRTALNVFSEEMRVASTTKGSLDWLGGVFYQHYGRHYGQDLPTPGYDALQANVLGIPVNAADNGNAPPDTPFYSNLYYQFQQYAFFGESTYHLNSQWSGTAGLRYYNFEEGRTQYFAGLFGCCSATEGKVNSAGFSPRAILTYKATEDLLFDAQVSRGFRLGGINDPLNKPLCSPQDLITFGHQGNWRDEKAWDYELGAKTQFLDRKVTLNASVFWTEIYGLQATTTAGTCSSRIVFNVPTSHSTGVEAELSARPNANWDFSLSTTWLSSELTSSVVSTGANGQSAPVGGLQSGNRLPTSPRIQAVAGVGYTKPVEPGVDFFSVATLQYIGSLYNQFEQEQPGFGQICSAAAACTGAAAGLRGFGGPLTTNVVNFSPIEKGYSLGNIRAGMKTKQWEVAAFVNNLWDTNAHLALDYERGRAARVAYLTNMPRLIGMTARYSF